MKAVTLYGQDRYSCLSDLPAIHLDRILECFRETYGRDITDPLNEITAWDMERHLDIHYVDKNRDLDKIPSISSEAYFVLHDRASFQPLLDALEKGDFELAEALTPEGSRLCGYTELKETTKMEEYGHGWAGQFAFTEVPAGIYPIFARKFAYHERDKHFTNEVHYTSIAAWFEGTCIASDSFDGPCPHIVLKTPYAYDLAKNVSKNVGSAHLIYPFRPLAFEHERADGKPFIHYTIVDSSVPYRAETNPLSLRKRCVPKNIFVTLDEKIRHAEQEKASKASPEAQTREPER